jgi:NAD(P)-dependent dehydrogenase (short-subunit alcohol dehydrogenase family)
VPGGPCQGLSHRVSQNLLNGAYLGAMTSKNTSNNTWFITGAGRGMGVEFARAALAAGHNVVATGRNRETITEAFGEQEQLLVVKLDITSPQDAEQAVQAAVERFGGINVLLNNAANFLAGFFEELSPQQVDTQLQTNLVGPMTVTRAVLPVMRKHRSGHVITISSVAGLVGQEFCSGVRCREIRFGGLDGVPGPGGRAVRHPHNHRGAGVLSYRAVAGRVDDLC